MINKLDTKAPWIGTEQGCNIDKVFKDQPLWKQNSQVHDVLVFTDEIRQIVNLGERLCSKLMSAYGAEAEGHGTSRPGIQWNHLKKILHNLLLLLLAFYGPFSASGLTKITSLSLFLRLSEYMFLKNLCIYACAPCPETRKGCWIP